MKKRVERLEQEVCARLTPTQEKNVARYLRLAVYSDESAIAEEFEESYEKVRGFLPRLH